MQVPEVQVQVPEAPVPEVQRGLVVRQEDPGRHGCDYRWQNVFRAAAPFSVDSQLDGAGLNFDVSVRITFRLQAGISRNLEELLRQSAADFTNNLLCVLLFAIQFVNHFANVVLMVIVRNQRSLSFSSDHHNNADNQEDDQE